MRLIFYTNVYTLEALKISQMFSISVQGDYGFSTYMKASRTEINCIKDHNKRVIGSSDGNMLVKMFCQSPSGEETSETKCLLLILNDVTLEKLSFLVRENKTFQYINSFS